MARNYSSVVEPKALTANITDASATQITLNNVTGLPSAPYVLVINPDTSKEEVVLVTVDQTGVTSPTLKVQRAIETSGGVGIARNDHTIGDVVKHMIVGSDLQIVHDHFSATTGIHGIAGALAPIASPTFTGTVVLPSTTSIGTVTSTELGYVDGVTSAIQTQFNTNTPAGVVNMWVGAAAPTGWLLCDGSAVSRTTYSALFAVISTTYGVGNGSTTFNLPDLLGRVPMGAGAGTGLTSRTLGAEVGGESTTLTSAHIPEHAHTINHGHTASGSTSIDTQGNHTHASNIEIAGSLANGGIYLLETNTTPRNPYLQYAGDHSHNASTSVTVDSITGNSGNYGTASPTAVTAVQPSTVVNFIIKY